MEMTERSEPLAIEAIEARIMAISFRDLAQFMTRDGDKHLLNNIIFDLKNLTSELRRLRSNEERMIKSLGFYAYGESFFNYPNREDFKRWFLEGHGCDCENCDGGAKAREALNAAAEKE